MHKQANSANNCAREMEFGWLHGGEDRNHSGVGLFEISRMLRHTILQSIIVAIHDISN